jgi:hypothetical protein
MIKILPLVRGVCPVCNKKIMNETKTALINGGFEFWVAFQDDTKAQFSICEDCYSKITQEQLDEILKSQVMNWGMEVEANLRWFYTQAVHLKIVKHARDKSGLTP